VRSLEVADDVDKEFIREINERRAELRSQREDWSDNWPKSKMKCGTHPTRLCLTTCRSPRWIEALRLEIRYDYNTRTATCRVTLLGDTIDVVAGTSREAVVKPFPEQTGSAVGQQPNRPGKTVQGQTSVRSMTKGAMSFT
jgi:hypothetical protein